MGIVVLRFCRSHFELMREVPMVGWDVAFTPNGIFLLEVGCCATCTTLSAIDVCCIV